MKAIIAVLAILSASCAVPIDTSDTEQEMRSQCWYGSTWWQCCLTTDDGTSGECCRTFETSGDQHCWTF